METATPKKRIQFKAPEGYYSFARTMEVLGCSRTTLYRIMGEGAFSENESIRFRGKRVFKKEAVTAYFDKYIEDFM